MKWVELMVAYIGGNIVPFKKMESKTVLHLGVVNNP